MKKVLAILSAAVIIMATTSCSTSSRLRIGNAPHKASKAETHTTSLNKYKSTACWE